MTLKKVINVLESVPMLFKSEQFICSTYCYRKGLLRSKKRQKVDFCSRYLSEIGWRFQRTKKSWPFHTPLFGQHSPTGRWGSPNKISFYRQWTKVIRLQPKFNSSRTCFKVSVDSWTRYFDVNRTSIAAERDEISVTKSWPLFRLPA